MAAEQPTTLGPKAVEQVAKTVREVARRVRNETPRRARFQQSGFTPDRAVVLDDELPAASDALTGGASCLARVCSWSVSISDYAETGSQITVWNHSEHTSHEVDTFGYARWIDGHWHFFGDCGPMASR